MIGAENLGKRFGRQWIFRGLSFSVEPGQRLAVIGRNGSGKSTLLRSLAGLLTPSEGRVTWGFADYRSCLGYASLDMSLYAHLSPSEHLRLASKLRGCEPRESELLSTVGLCHVSDLPSGRLSTGQRSRLKIALAIQPRPGALMLDEPGASLDEEGRTMVDQICRQQTERGCLIVATNSPEERLLATHELELG